MKMRIGRSTEYMELRKRLTAGKKITKITKKSSHEIEKPVSTYHAI